MTITATAPVTLADVMTELRLVTPGRAYPIALGDADVRALAGVASGPISLTDLLGKSSYIPMIVTPHNDSDFKLTNAGPVTLTCHPSVSVSQGSGGYTYLWEMTSSTNSPSLSGTTSAACTVSKSVAGFTAGDAQAVLRCTVTDNTGHVVITNGILGDLSWETGA